MSTEQGIPATSQDQEDDEPDEPLGSIPRHLGRDLRAQEIGSNGLVTSRDTLQSV
ncbi:MAG: hypothetical protein AB9869_13575 [Verrucomicrobiia bacterium]